jgi:hypothetical protein
MIAETTVENLAITAVAPTAPKNASHGLLSSRVTHFWTHARATDITGNGELRLVAQVADGSPRGIDHRFTDSLHDVRKLLKTFVLIGV